jgi:hypothetical protein
VSGEGTSFGVSAYRRGLRLVVSVSLRGVSVSGWCQCRLRSQESEFRIPDGQTPIRRLPLATSSHRELHRYYRAFSRFALHVDSAAMQVDAALHDDQAERLNSILPASSPPMRSLSSISPAIRRVLLRMDSKWSLRSAERPIHKFSLGTSNSQSLTTLLLSMKIFPARIFRE